MKHLVAALVILLVVVGLAVSLDPRGALTFLGYITLLLIGAMCFVAFIGAVGWALYRLFALSKGGFE